MPHLYLTKTLSYRLYSEGGKVLKLTECLCCVGIFGVFASILPLIL